ncbi:MULTISPECIES: YrrS family protein [Bacillus]|uniref:YrrS family protein n=1 Tax=Bacillus mojavensis TaxID=72360 RepID=A0AAP3FY61_BACMO|nr:MULTISPECIES: YrrS family protein [Bacillus]MCC2928321.1 YrrS family protein [Bacillus sp. LBG-1-113]MCY8106547.1 YrrS family protein [Bacillus mojavensis]MCY8480041.1 YrrS family protein [Bacillus mojavensis]MCY8509125.1 YrrS family protein [Bacillus mojavensis]MCY9190903.1 YrrS family protein [Bacillus mojavensis]
MSNNQSRYENRDKRRKANLVLNILIAIVSILIVVVAANLFINSPSSKDVSKDSETAQKQESPASGKTEKKSDEDIKDSKKDTSDKSEKDSEKSSDSDSDSKKDDSSKSDDSDSDSDSSSDSDDPLKDAKVTEGGSSSDVEKTYENPDWKAVGTEQKGEHAATYDSSSQDWAEMLKAISYATGVSTDNMTVLWLGNNGSPQDAKGKILDKTSGEKYQVTITWVDGKGWKPTKVEKLK